MSSTRPLSRRAALLVLVALFSNAASHAHASGRAPRVDPSVGLASALSDGTFLVLSDSSTSFVIFGAAPPRMAKGQPESIAGSGEYDDFLVAARPLADRHPALLDALRGAPVRLAASPPSRTEPSALCETTIADVRVARILSRGWMEFGRSLQSQGNMTRSNEARIAWSSQYDPIGEYVIGTLSAPCPNAVLATTHVSTPARSFVWQTLVPEETLPFTFAFQATDAQRRADAVRAGELGDDPRARSIDVSAIAIGPTRRLIFVSDSMSTGCTHAHFETALMIDENGEVMRATQVVSVPVWLFDLDGDGTVEWIESGDDHDWSRILRRFDPGSGDVRLLRSFGVPTNIGC